MATKRSGGVRPEVVRCPCCGEDYSVTYKRCPFCDGQRDNDPNSSDPDHTAPRGRRVANNTRGGGYGGGWGPLHILGTVISLALIAAAVWIVITVVSPILGRGQAVAAVSDSAGQTDTAQASQSAESGTPSPSGSPSPFTLNREDFTLDSGETFTLAATFSDGADGHTLTWSSSDPSVATVSDTGLVTPVGSGVVKITATEAGGYEQTCTVRCKSSGGVSAAALSLNNTDFTLDHTGQTFQLKVSGASGTPSWSVENTAVATVNASGTVTAVGHGTTTITASVDGQSLTATVRCSF